MSDYSVSVPLSEIMRLALPSGSDFLVSDLARVQPVQWAVVVGVPLRRDELMEEGDLVVVAVRSDKPAWDTAMRRFVDLGVAAVTVDQPVPGEALEIAAAAELPVVKLPEDSDLRTVHRGVLTLILKHEAQIAQRSAEIARQLNRIAADEEAGLPALAEVIASQTGHGVLVQDKRLKVVAVQQPDNMDKAVWNRAVGKLSDAGALPEGWADRRATAKKARGQVEFQELSDGLGRMVTPIVVKHLARGYLSVIGPGEELDALDELAVEQGAEVFAMTMAKAKAVSEATKRLRGEFVDAVLSGSISPAELERWAGRLGHNIYAPHTVVIFAWRAGTDNPSLRRMETLVNGEIGLGRHSALVRNAGNQIEAFIVLDDPDSIQNALSLAVGVRDQGAREYPDMPVLSGIGRVANRLEEWPISYKQATQALSTAQRLDEHRPLFFGDLSVYRLLFQMEDHPELTQFCEEMLGKLLAYDEQHNSTLVETLSEYFAKRGNLTQTAEALYIHRNTLQYRMDRISEIAGLSLDNPDTRLAMQLALKAYKLLPSSR